MLRGDGTAGYAVNRCMPTAHGRTPLLGYVVVTSCL